MATIKRGRLPRSQKAKHGGQAVREKYGPEFYSKIGKKGGETVKEKRGPKFYAEIGKKGGESTKRHQGSEFYSKIGKKGVSADELLPHLKTSGRKPRKSHLACTTGDFLGFLHLSRIFFINGGTSISSVSKTF